MSSVVCKFGGSSLSDAEMWLRVRDIILACPDRRYIVLSAPGKRMPDDEKITDLLYQAHACGASGDHSIFSRIFQRYASIRDRLVPYFDLETEFACIRSNITQSADFFASRGEYLCAKLFAAFMKWPFVDAAELFFFAPDGSIDMGKSFASVREKLLPLEHAVVPGFYGSAALCGVRTFTRGGSDVSGALLATAVNAKQYENWTDVDGLFSADPNLVPEAIRHPEVSLDQMQRIARAGAKLLHPDALLPIKGSGIDTVIKNTRSPASQGTIIREGFPGTVRCVTGLHCQYMVQAAHGESSVLLHPTPISAGRPVAVISAFGLDDEQLQSIFTRLNPIHIIHMQDHKKIIIEEDGYNDAVRKIHDILMPEY